MAKEIKFTPAKTYKTKKTMEKAIDDLQNRHKNLHLRYVVAIEEETGRYYPIFVGMELIILVHDRFCVTA